MKGTIISTESVGEKRVVTVELEGQGNFVNMDYVELVHAARPIPPKAVGGRRVNTAESIMSSAHRDDRD